GRLLADANNDNTGAVTLNNSTVTKATCAAATSGSSGGSVGSVNQNATLNVVKTVINDNGKTKIVADFPLFVTVLGNIMRVFSGVTNTFTSPAPAYIVSETSDSNYTQTFSGDCDANGNIKLIPGAYYFCILTNNDIGAPVVVPPVPPLIDVVKVPTPLALPNGPGSVLYTYTVRNIGTVPMTDVSLVGDTCSPIVLSSGDINNDAKLDLNEVWVHTCSTILSETHTNTVVATGWANGISASDIANATVVVGVPVVPPLIHVTKVPSPLTLLATGGMVTYTEQITNPGTVALNNVKLSDDKCAPMKYISGDSNGDSKLDNTETWTYTCKTNLTKTTTNTAIASGQANGILVRDFAIATVVVANAIPKLPNTGFSPTNGVSPSIITAIVLLLLSISFIMVLRKSKI
ncbi:MAG: hypothetical protein Q7S24_02015, partial [bacterium]|nr:hypothetical protein [bacterium]